MWKGKTQEIPHQSPGLTTLAEPMRPAAAFLRDPIADSEPGLRRAISLDRLDCVW